MTSQVLLSPGRQRAATDGVSIHYAFVDGALAFDCAACDQRCCKTGSLAVFPRERDLLVQLSPALELVAPSDGSAIALFATPPSGCWFLREQRCSLATLHKGALRPLACALFPYNLFALHGEALAVAPNPVCPMRVAPGRGVRHAEVTSLLGRIGVAGAPPEPVRTHDGAGALALERVVRELCGATLTTKRPQLLLGLCEQLTDAFVAGGAGALADAPLDDAGARGRGDELLTRLAGIVGVPPPPAAALAAVAPLLAAWTPSLRLFGFEAVPLVELPRAFAALTLYAATWAAARPGRALVPQTLPELVGSLGPSCAALAAWDAPWRGAPVPSLGLEPGVAPAAIEHRLPGEPLERALALRAIGDALSGVRA